MFIEVFKIWARSPSKSKGGYPFRSDRSPRKSVIQSYDWTCGERLCCWKNLLAYTSLELLGCERPDSDTGFAISNVLLLNLTRRPGSLLRCFLLFCGSFGTRTLSMGPLCSFQVVSGVERLRSSGRAMSRSRERLGGRKTVSKESLLIDI